MARSIIMLITVTETGKITLDVRGPVDGKEGIIQILDSARKLAEQGRYGQGREKPGQDPLGSR